MSLIRDALKKVEEQRLTARRATAIVGRPGIRRPRLRQRRGLLIVAVLVLLSGAVFSLGFLHLGRRQPGGHSGQSQGASSLARIRTQKALGRAEQQTRVPAPPAKIEKPPRASQTPAVPASQAEAVVAAATKPSPSGAGPAVAEEPAAGSRERSSGEPRRSVSPQSAKVNTGALAASKATGLVQLRIETQTNPAADYRRAVALQKQGRWEEAEAAYQRVLQRLPVSAEVYNNLGVIYEKQGRLDKAVKCYEKAIELDPRFCASFNNLGIVFYRQREYDMARAAYQRALALNPDNSQSLVNLALVYNRLGRRRQARQLLEQAVRLRPDSPEAHYNLGWLLEQQGNVEAALQHYRYFLALTPSAYPRLRRRVEASLQELQARMKRQ